MTARCYVAGHIAPRSQPARMTVRGQAVEPTRTPLGESIAAFLATDPEPCPVCGRYDCDCDEWPELMYTDPIEERPCIRCHRYNCNCAAQPFNVDPHGDLTWRDSLEINYEEEL